MGEGKDFVTLKTVNSLLEAQVSAFKSAFQMMFQDVKEELKAIKTDIGDLKNSAQFSMGQVDDLQEKVKSIEKTVNSKKQNIEDITDSLDAVESHLEYIENQSRCNNIKIMGVPEDISTEKTWDDTEDVVKKLIKEELGIEEEVEIERCHRVGDANPANRRKKGNSSNQNGGNEKPRSIVAKFAKWKTKEFILKTARNEKPQGIMFVGDFSQRTLDKRAAKIPDLIKARKEDKIAYFIMDRLIVKNKVNTKGSQNSSESEDLEFGDWGDYKMVLVVRHDLGMGKGKAAAQCCHAAVAVYNKAKRKHPQWLQSWEQAACPKIVVKAPDEDTLLELAAKADSLDLDVVVIKDAGRTQIAPGSKTVMGLGPAPTELIDQVTGVLKLY